MPVAANWAISGHPCLIYPLAVLKQSVIKIISPLAVQMMTVSSHTPAALANPCLTGWLVSAAAAVGMASPIPDADENVPRLIPCCRSIPMVPPKMASIPKADWITFINRVGTWLMFVMTIRMAANK